MLRQKVKKMTLEVKEEEPEDSWEIVSHWDDNEKWDEDIKPKYDRRNELYWDEGTDEVYWEEKVTEPNWIEESTYKAEKVKKKKKKSPSIAARVSAFWVFAIKECGWTGLRGADLAFFAGRPGGWPSLRPEEKQKYVEEAKKLTKKNRAKLSAS